MLGTNGYDEHYFNTVSGVGITLAGRPDLSLPLVIQVDYQGIRCMWLPVSLVDIRTSLHRQAPRCLCCFLRTIIGVAIGLAIPGFQPTTNHPGAGKSRVEPQGKYRDGAATKIRGSLGQIIWRSCIGLGKLQIGLHDFELLVR